ncbi:MAG: ATP-binding protein [bacterium]
MVDSFLLQYSFSYLLGGIVFAILAVFVFFKAPKQLLNRVFALYCLCVSWWSFFSILMINAPSEVSATFWDRLCLVGVVFIPSTFIHFNYILLGYLPRFRRFILTTYILSAFFFVANFFPLLVEHTSPKFGLNYYTDPGPFYLPFVVYFFTLSIFTIFVLFFAQKRATGAYKKQISFLFWAVLLGYSLGGNNYNLSFGIGPSYLALIGNLGVMMYGLMVAYTITKYRLMDISVVINRSAAEILTVLFLASGFLSIVWFFDKYFAKGLSLSLVLAIIVYGIFVGHNYLKLRLFLQTSSERVFLQGKYNYYQTLSRVSAQVGEKLSLPSILDILYKTFSNIMEASKPRIFLLNNFGSETKPRYYVVYDKQTFGPDGSGEKIMFNDPLLAKLFAKRAPLVNMHDPEQEVIVPCLLEDRLVAFFILGAKLSEEGYTDEEINLLEMLANQVAVALEHSRSYEKISTELALAERQLGRSQRLASLGALAAGVTHEIQSPLAQIRSRLEHLPDEPRDIKYLKEHKDFSLRYIDRIAGVVQRMLGIAKEKERKPGSFNLNEIIEPALKLVSLKDVSVKKKLGEISMIDGDRGELEEIFVNLLQNAVQAMQGKGTLFLTTYMAAERVVAEVTDTGGGIPGELSERIFDPFFSTKHGGVGLGLSIVHRLVRGNGGEIEVVTKLGQGTTFRLIF